MLPPLEIYPPLTRVATDKSGFLSQEPEPNVQAPKPLPGPVPHIDWTARHIRILPGLLICLRGPDPRLAQLAPLEASPYALLHEHHHGMA